MGNKNTKQVHSIKVLLVFIIETINPVTLKDVT